MLEMTYFRAELVRLIVSQSDSELEVQRYGMKIDEKYFDCWSYHAARWIVNETWKTSPNRRSRFLKTKPRKPSFWFLNFDVGSVQLITHKDRWTTVHNQLVRFLETDIRHFHRVPHTPTNNLLWQVHWQKLVGILFLTHSVYFRGSVLTSLNSLKVLPPRLGPLSL